MTSSTACCCYAIDEGYIIPTLLSAIQVRKFNQVSELDVIIFCFGLSKATSIILNDVCAKQSIELISLPHISKFNLPMYFARFLICDFLDNNYKRIIYLDGDTQIVGSLMPILRMDKPRIQFSAVLDPMAIAMRASIEGVQSKKNYFTKLGLSDTAQRNYFNSGILVSETFYWRDISHECRSISPAALSKLKFPDQDLLNIHIQGDYCQLSFRWNFPSFLIGNPVERAVKPTIYHFMSNPRPWHGAFPPWGSEWTDPYIWLSGTYKDISILKQSISKKLYIKYMLQQYYKKFFEANSWRSGKVLETFQEYETNSTKVEMTKIELL